MRYTRMIIIILVLSGACTMPSCKTGGDDHMRTVNSYRHPRYGQIRVVFLQKSGTIKSWPCQRGKIRFYNNGKLLSFTLSEDYLKGDDRIPQGSRITLYQNGNPEYIRLARNTKVQGHRVAHNSRFSDVLTMFYEEGGLKQFQPVADTLIEGIPCSDQSGIILYPDGQLMVCQLSNDLKQGEKFFPLSTKVVIIENRIVYEYTPDIHLSIQSRLNMVTYVTEKVSQAYGLRMEGRIHQAYNAAEALTREEGSVKPLAHYELARIKRHKLMGGITDEWADAILRETMIAVNMDRYNILFAIFDSDCLCFAGTRARERGDTIQARGYYLRAIEGLERVLSMKPDHHPAMLSLVDLYSRLPEFLGGDREKADRHADALKDYGPVWAARAESILLPDEAQRLEYWIAFQESFQEDPDVLYELGRAYLMNNDVVNGDHCYRRAMELDSARIILLTDLARYHLQKIKEKEGNFSEHLESAEEYLHEYLESEPVHPVEAWCYARLAGINEMKGKNIEAEKFLAKAAKLDEAYLKQDRLPPMIIYDPPGELSDEYYSYFDAY